MSFACKHLKVHEEQGAVEVTLFRPDVRNAFNAELIAELHELARQVGSRKDVRVVFLRGDGPLFCSGGDLNWMKSSLGWSEQENIADANRLSSMLSAWNEMPKPVVGLIHGGAYGGGVGLVSVCDHVVAVRDTVFSLSEVRLGLIPACIGPFVVEKVGWGQARSLFVSGERFKADKALAIGLVHELVSTSADLETVRTRMMDVYAACGPGAIATAKSFLRNLKGLDAKQGNELAARTLALLRVGAEAQEGIKSFLEKRKPKWP